MARIDEKRKQRLEQAIRDMGNYGVKLRKPEELPDFDQPSIMKRKREGLSLLIKLRNKMTRRVTRIFLNRPIKKQRCRQQKGLLLPKNFIKEWEKQRTESNYPSFRGNISSLSQQPPQSRVCIRGNPTKVRLRGAENR